jgi:hypothetical protein
MSKATDDGLKILGQEQLGTALAVHWTIAHFDVGIFNT